MSEQLRDARARRQKLRDAGIPAAHLDREILELRRQLREGGQLRAGDALSDGRYLLVRAVGRGGFAVVWEAYDGLTQQRVAIKVLHANLAGDPLRRERFFRGARAMMDLAHPAVVRVLEPEGEDAGFYYFVMEFVSGSTLREAVLQGLPDKELILPLMIRISEAVARAHAKGMIHRDIKPMNILLDRDGNPKLTDFDLVHAHDTTGGTRTGALGTFLYAAPECLDKPQEVTAQSDVYGLGMTAIFCLLGQEPPRSILRNPDPTIENLSCSIPVKEVLQRAVAWEPEDRFADAAALAAALREAMDASSETDVLAPGLPATKLIILFLAANPGGTSGLALDREVRAIQEALERSGHRDRIELVVRWQVTPLDLLRDLRTIRPTVVHFSGHGVYGEQREGLMFQNAHGGAELVSTAALTEVFGVEGASVRLVVLNASYSERQAEALLAHVACAVGIEGNIHDEAARSFAVGLYGGLVEGASVAASFRLGRALLSLEGLPGRDCPQLMVRADVNADLLVLVAAPAASRVATRSRPPRRGDQQDISRRRDPVGAELKRKHTILFLSATPTGVKRSAFDREFRSIEIELERSAYKDRFEFKAQWALGTVDLLRAIHKFEPTVVHFSVHGDEDGIALQHQDGGVRIITTDTVAEMFAAVGASVKVVVLSGCYNEALAEALLAHVDCVVGIDGRALDDSARAFAIGFYSALGEHESIGAAYKQGCAAIRIERLPDGDRPQLKVRAGVDADRLVLAVAPS